MGFLATAAPDAEAFRAFVSEIAADLGWIVPELILVAGICVLVLADLFIRKERSPRLAWPAFGTVVAAAVALFASGRMGEKKTLFAGMIENDAFGSWFKAFFLAGTAAAIPIVSFYDGFRGRRMGEFYALLLGSVLGMFLMASARNALMIVLGIEFSSLCCYLLAGYRKSDRRSAEAGLKYVIYGSVAAGLMLYGLSLFYGLVGSLDIGALAGTLRASRLTDTTLLVACLLTFAGFAYKVAAFPMHFWCPDVYEGAPTPFTAFLSVTSKGAGFAVMIRFLWAFPESGRLELAGGTFASVDWGLIVAVISVMTMTVGNLAALFQRNLKRMLAWSSIAHAGYLLMGVAALHRKGAGPAGYEVVAFYMLVYLFMNLGAFFVVTVVASRHGGSEDVEAYRGLGRRSPFLAFGMAVFLFSLIGVPPTGGFTGKLQLFMVAVQQDLVWLALAAAVNTAISVYYYARVLRNMYLEPGGDEALALPRRGVLLLGAFVVPTLGLGVIPGAIVRLTQTLAL